MQSPQEIIDEIAREQVGDEPLSYIDRVITSDEFQRRAAEAEAHWARYFRTFNASFSQMLVLEQAIKLMHQGNRP